MKRPPIAVAVVAAALASALLAVYLTSLRPVQAIDGRLSDLRIGYFNTQRAPYPDITLVTFGQSTVGGLRGPGVVNKRYLANVLRQLERAGARAVGVALSLEEPSPGDGGAQLIAALNATRIPVVLSQSARLGRDGELVGPPDGQEGPRERTWRELREAVDNPLVTDGLGAVLAEPPDGAVRRLYAGQQVDGVFAPSFAVALARAVSDTLETPSEAIALDYYGRPSPEAPSFERVAADVFAPADQGAVALAPTRPEFSPQGAGPDGRPPGGRPPGGRPPGASGDARPAPPGPDAARADAPSSGPAVLDPAVGQLIAGRIILIGFDLPDADRVVTPFPNTPPAPPGAPLVEVQAHALAQMLDGRTRQTPTLAVTIAISVVLALLVAIADARLRALWSRAILGLGAPAVYVLACFAAFAWADLMLPVLAPVLAMLFAFIVATALLEAHHRRDSRLVSRAFAQYASPHLLEAMRKDPTQLALGGEQRVITVLLTDLTDSVGLAERLDPSDLVAVLNVYLDGISTIVLEHDGAIDKFIGDAVMAMFGAPVVQPDHAERAVRCAVAISAFTEAFRAQQAANGVAFGRTRVGVHTGLATVGNFGGQARFDYTAMGSVTNVCARLEQANKALGTHICVSEATCAACPDMAFRPSGLLRLRGVGAPVGGYEPVAAAMDKSALEAYRRAYMRIEDDPEAARAAFAELAGRSPDDPLIGFHHRRLEAGERTALIGA